MPSISGNYIIDRSKSESCARFSQRLVGASSKDFRDIYQVKNISFGEFLDSQWYWLGLCDFTAGAWVPGWGVKILETASHGQKPKIFFFEFGTDHICSFFSASIFLCSILTAPGGSDSKESPCNAGDLGSIPVLGRSPGEGNGNPL